MANYEYVILGGGLVAGYAAQAFVESGLERGQLAIISAESMLPYERPPLSKDFLLGDATKREILINDRDFYQSNDITVSLENPAREVKFDERKLVLEDGEEIFFGKLLIATGSKVTRFELKGSALDKIFYLRRVGDALRIRQTAAKANRATVIGGSFIGMEVASGLQQLGMNVTLVFPEARVWEALFTPQMSDFFEGFYRRRGVHLVREAEVERFEGGPAVRNVVVRQKGTDISIPSEMVVAGIGVTPNLDLFSNEDIEIDDGIIVDRYLETSVRDVFAAGDIACYPDEIFDGRRRVEHWDNAYTQGQHAAQVMLGKRKPYVHVPYFFSDVFDLSYEYWGDGSRADEIIHRGNLETGSFSVWWLDKGRLLAAFLMDRPEEERELAPRWIERREIISSDILRDESQLLSEQIPA